MKYIVTGNIKRDGKTLEGRQRRGIRHRGR
ncbi:hypothetical protein RLIN73S_06117 [Rhodanobacter lindaniclasticus]